MIAPSNSADSPASSPEDATPPTSEADAAPATGQDAQALSQGVDAAPPATGSQQDGEVEPVRDLASQEQSLAAVAAPRKRGRPSRSASAKARSLDDVFAYPKRKSVPITNVLTQTTRIKKVLRDTLLFRDVDSADFERFYEMLRWRRVASGAQVLAGGDRSPWVFVLVEGTAKIHQNASSGAQVIYSICGPGELLGELSALDGGTHSATVTMLETSLLGALDRDEFLDFLLSVPQSSLNLAALTSRRLRGATARIHALSRLDVTGRLVAQLLLFAAHYGQAPPGAPPEEIVERFDPERAALEGAGIQAPKKRKPEPALAIDLHLRQSDLADLIGASRVRVNQALHQLRRSGLLTVSGNRITLLDVDALRARCE